MVNGMRLWIRATSLVASMVMMEQVSRQASCGPGSRHHS
jgi:hypothetical protein